MMNTSRVFLTDRNQIRKAWSKSESDVFKDIKIIRDWLTLQKHLPEIPTDNMIEFFLTNCKYSIEKAKQNLDMYYTVRTLIPDLYRNKNPCKPEMEAAHNTAYLVSLPKLTSSLHRITLLKYKDFKSDDADLKGVFSQCLNNIYEIRCQEDLAMGEIYIVDLQNATLGHMMKITPILLKQTVFVLKNVHSFRMHQIHFYKMPSFFDTLITIFKNLLGEKLSKRIYIHQTIEELTKYIPLDLLPSNYGGKEKSLDELSEIWQKKMFEYEDRFAVLENISVNEDLRPEPLKNDELLGYYGNFKNINTD